MKNTSLPELVKLVNVSKNYSIEAQIVQALKNINLTIYPGDAIAIIGKSGAGKSTLLHIIGTLDKPSFGRLIINENDVCLLNDISTSRFRNQTMGFVFQMNNLLPEFTALENTMLPGMIRGKHSKKEIQEKAYLMLKSVGLEHRYKHRPGELSGGEQQRVAIARALLLSPPLLLADEPTGNLDNYTSRGIQDLLLQLCSDKKTTMLLVTHDMELAKKLPQQLVMDDGHIITGGGEP